MRRCCILMLACGLVCVTQTVAATPKIGGQAPLFALDTLTGKKVRLRSLRGRKVVLVVGRTKKSAPLCRRWMQALVKTPKPLPFHLYQVVVVDKSWYVPRALVRSKLRGFVEKQHRWRVLIEWYLVFARQYGIQRHDDPTLFIIDERGTLALIHRGRHSKASLARITGALRGRAPLRVEESRRAPRPHPKP